MSRKRVESDESRENGRDLAKGHWFFSKEGLIDFLLLLLFFVYSNTQFLHCILSLLFHFERRRSRGCEI